MSEVRNARDHCLLLLLPLAVVTYGCSQAMAIRVRNPDTGEPIAGLRVERYRQACLAEKIVNPVGTFYHPLILADTTVTSLDGRAAFKRSHLRDVYRVYCKRLLPLRIDAWGRHVQTSLPPISTGDAPWVHSVWREEDGLGSVVEPDTY